MVTKELDLNIENHDKQRNSFYIVIIESLSILVYSNIMVAFFKKKIIGVVVSFIYFHKIYTKNTKLVLQENRKLIEIYFLFVGDMVHSSRFVIYFTSLFRSNQLNQKIYREIIKKTQILDMGIEKKIGIFYEKKIEVMFLHRLQTCETQVNEMERISQ